VQERDRAGDELTGRFALERRGNLRNPGSGAGRGRMAERKDDGKPEKSQELEGGF